MKVDCNKIWCLVFVFQKKIDYKGTKRLHICFLTESTGAPKTGIFRIRFKMLSNILNDNFPSPLAREYNYGYIAVGIWSEETSASIKKVNIIFSKFLLNKVGTVNWIIHRGGLQDTLMASHICTKKSEIFHWKKSIIEDIFQDRIAACNSQRWQNSQINLNLSIRHPLNNVKALR